MSRFFLLTLLSTLLFSLGLVHGQSSSVNSTQAMSLAAQNDVITLNYALTLENLEAAFYAQGLAIFNNATVFNNVSAAVPNGTLVYNYLQLIAGHEATHVSFLTAAINAAVPGAAVPACQYKFAAAGAFASPQAFLATAALLENTGQTAYDGALNGITTAGYALVAAEIATVEARHAAFLNLLTGTVPFPQAFDNATMPTIIAAAITPLLVSCPYNITLPQVRPTGVTLATNGSTVGTGSLNGTLGYSAAQKANDLVALNYALTLENLEAAFYNYILANFSYAQFIAAGLPGYYYNYTQLIAAHENLHVATLTTVINGRQPGAAVPACQYNFTGIRSLTGAGGYLAIAQLLENTGVMAYDGAANTITDTTLQQVAATIATVEGRHASFLNYANAGIPFPQAFDNGTLPNVIIAAVLATGLITSCPYTPVGPTVVSAFPAATSVLGDPAFVGFHGQSFQVHGIPSRHFSLISTPDLQLSATFIMIEQGEAMTAGQMKQTRLMREITQASAASHKANKPSLQHLTQSALPITTAFSHSGTFLGAVAIQLKGVKVYAKAGQYAEGIEELTVDGVTLPLSSSPVQVAVNCFITHPTRHTLIIDTELVSFTLVNSDRFFNLEQATLNRPYTDDMLIDGLLGQTANPAWQVQNSAEFKQHQQLDYLITGELFSNEFQGNMYKQ